MSATATYKSSPTKRKRRSKADMLVLRDELYSLVEQFQPMTVRQIFYQMVSRGIIAKAESEYKNTVCRLLTAMRRDGDLPYHWIADNTRWMRKPRTYSSIGQMLDQTQRFYRRSVWVGQDAYVEVWLEKEALAGVLYDVTDRWDDVGLTRCRW